MRRSTLLEKARVVFFDVVSYKDPEWATASLPAHRGGFTSDSPRRCARRRCPPGFRPMSSRCIAMSSTRWSSWSKKKAINSYKSGLQKNRSSSASTTTSRKGCATALARMTPEEFRAGKRRADRGRRGRTIARSCLRSRGGCAMRRALVVIFAASCATAPQRSAPVAARDEDAARPGLARVSRCDAIGAPVASESPARDHAAAGRDAERSQLLGGVVRAPAACSCKKVRRKKARDAFSHARKFATRARGHARGLRARELCSSAKPG